MVKNIRDYQGKTKIHRYSLGEEKLRRELYKKITETRNKLVRQGFRVAGRINTVGGAAIESFPTPGVRMGMHVVVGIQKKGAAPVTVVEQKCDLDKITVEFSADPSTDHIITFMVCQ